MQKLAMMPHEDYRRVLNEPVTSAAMQKPLPAPSPSPVVQGRKRFLVEAEKCITVDRAKTHGDAEQSFELIAAYWSVHLGVPVTAVDVTAMMALFKLARLKGNPAHEDNWTDGIGYLAIGGELATRDQK